MAKGQKSLALTEKLYDEISKFWGNNKQKLEKKYGVSSFTAYANHLLSKGVQEELLETRFEIVNRFENELRVRDYFLGRDATVRLVVDGPYGAVYCDLDKTGKCPHVGFVLSDSEVLKIAKEHGISFRRSPKSVTLEEASAIFDRVTGKKEEVSDKDFISKTTSETDYDQAQAKEMLRMLYGDFRIVISKVHGDVYYFKKALL